MTVRTSAGAVLGHREGDGWIQGLGVSTTWRWRGLGLALLFASLHAFWTAL